MGFPECLWLNTCLHARVCGKYCSKNKGKKEKENTEIEKKRIRTRAVFLPCCRLVGDVL